MYHDHLVGPRTPNDPVATSYHSSVSGWANCAPTPDRDAY